METHYCYGKSQNINPTLEIFPLLIGKLSNSLTEEKSFSIKPIGQYLSDKKWFRKVSSNKKLSIGEQIYYLPKATKNTDLTICFDLQHRHLIFRDNEEQIASLNIKLSIDFDTIAGSNFTNQLKNRQLQIPLEWNQTKINTAFCPINHDLMSLSYQY